MRMERSERVGKEGGKEREEGGWKEGGRRGEGGGKERGASENGNKRRNRAVLYFCQYLLSSFGKMTKTTGRMDKTRLPITMNGSLNPPA